MLKKIRFPIVCSSLLIVFVIIIASCEGKTPASIITDDIIMLTRPATGLETFACANFAASRSTPISTKDSISVSWSEAKVLANDSIKIVRLEFLSDTGSLVKFTMTLRPLSGRPSEIQCMKGFGCATQAWENFPWKSPAGNFLDQTQHQFRVFPRGVGRFTIENYNSNRTLTVRVNPPI